MKTNEVGKYICSECKETFRLKFNLVHHMKKHKKAQGEMEKTT